MFHSQSLLAVQRSFFSFLSLSFFSSFLRTTANLPSTIKVRFMRKKKIPIGIGHGLKLGLNGNSLQAQGGKGCHSQLGLDQWAFANHASECDTERLNRGFRPNNSTCPTANHNRLLQKEGWRTVMKGLCSGSLSD
ncbi:hypothetical protein IE53DRAFT_384101 [Violaceomyces palustris]|uniref:Uncharacterized protein n=1 Tax=Violaceomyces palustris TaxID=1673888 RepID=A0ACD0P5Z0_9BASI|nr:hypothetical protein IE53DRAFT_384101 [Violaceomyces palustris]